MCAIGRVIVGIKDKLPVNYIVMSSAYAMVFDYGKHFIILLKYNQNNIGPRTALRKPKSNCSNRQFSPLNMIS